MHRLAATAKRLPRKPGVYLFHDRSGEIVYVGKAKNLRARVSSYFRPSADLAPAKAVMVESLTQLETIIVRSETEALLLESTLIKKHRPKYNVILKDDKSFQYIRIALAEDYPTVTTVRRMTLDGSRYFGPYVSGFAVRQTLKLLKRLFPYKNCPNRPDLPCFDAQLGRCLGHDTGPGSQARYRGVIDGLIDFLQGNTGGVIHELRRAMADASRHHDYESAARYRDRLQSLESILADQVVISTSHQSFDALGLARSDRSAMMTVFSVRRGKLLQRDSHALQHAADTTDQEIFESFITQYYTQSTAHPNELYIPIEIDPTVGEALQLRIHQAQRGLKRKLVSMAIENASESLAQDRTRQQQAATDAALTLEGLTRALHLESVPSRIEMYDVSNIQGKHVVASMVVFQDGQPAPQSYRKFTIRNQAIPDDMHRLAEVLRRRFAHRADDGWPLPDLLLLDGGIPQLNVVLRSVPGLGQHIPVAALAKENEEIFVPGESIPIRLPRDSAELRLLQQIRDEAHRFAIGFYRRTHRRESLRSILDDIPGLGPEGKKQLLQTFGTMTKIRNASDDQLAKILGPARARRVRDTLGPAD